MGIDIPNIRHVIHLSPALSVTDYTQQIGRAGRDNKQSYAHLLYNEKYDDNLLKYMSQIPLQASNFEEKHGYNDDDVNNVRIKLEQQVDDMLNLVGQSDGEEWQFILDYFGEAKPSFWDKWGKIIVDMLVALVLIFIITSILTLMMSIQ